MSRLWALGFAFGRHLLLLAVFVGGFAVWGLQTDLFQNSHPAGDLFFFYFIFSHLKVDLF